MYFNSYLKMKLSFILVLTLDNLQDIIVNYGSFLTLSLILLTNIILVLTLLIVNRLENRINSDFIFILGLILYISFSTYNLFIFYLSFESVIIPMIYLISISSSSILAKYRALYRFSLYTIIGGLLLLIFLLICVLLIGNFSYHSMILYNNLSCFIQLMIFPFLLITFLIKLPIIPFHIWLPDTHGEASTAGSVILAALLLKLGGLGLIRWLIPILPFGYLFYRPIIFILGLLSTIYASITTLRHIDIKKLIAYSSISHIGLVLIGIVSFSIIAHKGVIILLFSHGLVSALLFFLIGFLYVRTNTRYIIYYKGLTTVLPLLSVIWFIALLLNSAFPPLLPFLSEFLIIQSIFLYETIGCSLIVIAILFSGIYSLFLFCRIFFSTLTIFNKFNDINFREFSIIFPLILFSLIFSFSINF